jgi:ubiquinone/menaquinone biosynthesis C-methylase UbiE
MNELAEAVTAGYTRWRKSRLGSITDALEQRLLLELLGDVAGQAILDVGCGDGEFAIELWQRGARVTGIDASPQMIDAARARAQRQGADIRFEIATAQALPFEAAAFDRVVAVTVLCFLADGQPTLSEIARVLRIGGRFVIGELNKWSAWAADRRVRAWFGHPIWRSARFRSPSELRHLVESAGLVVQMLHGAVYYPHFGLAARLLGRFDRQLSRITPIGAAFLAVRAEKPNRSPLP